jgi:hypothetical protein
VPRQLFAFDVTIPLGTPVVSPVTVNLTMPPRVVRRVSWRVPPGPAGLMGWALAAAGQPMIPVNSGQWIVTNDEADTWDVDQYLTSGAWQLMGWNTGLFDHHVYLRFQVDLVQDLNTVQPVAPIPVDQLAPFTAADLAAVTSGNLSADALASLASVPAVDPSLGGVQ